MLSRVHNIMYTWFYINYKREGMVGHWEPVMYKNSQLSAGFMTGISDNTLCDCSIRAFD